ncbi:MAG: ATP-binding protein [Ilumatobacter sp.]|uniref:sensor histidine kinase n=1 Tax=Ilumatobacter sp. TaxID=1967498 RepID=UPI003C77B581
MRVRLTALAVALTVSAVVAGSLALLSNQRTTLTSTIDDALQVRADGLEAVLAETPVEPTLANRTDGDAVVQIIGPDGAVLSATDNVSGEAAIVDPRTTPGDEIRTITVPPIDAATFRVLTRTIDTDRGPATLAVATRFDAITQSLAALTRSLAVAVPLLGLLVGIISWIVIGRTLRPVETIRREVDTIATTNLDRRVPAGRRDSELGRLANTMNGMLTRIERGHHRQQQFVADASHELRSPLTRMRGHLEVDQRTDADRTQLAATHVKILDDLAHLEALVDDLLVLARHDEAAPLARAEPVDLDDIVLADVDKRRSVSSVVFDTGRVSGAQVTGDPKQLARAIRNVLDNAERHAATTVEIHVSEPTAVSARIVIHDDGTGIPTEMHDTLFERFRQVDDARSPTRAGTGLGLAITRAIVERHHGTIAFDRETTRGARLVITLPRATTAATRRPTEPDPEERRSQRPHRSMSTEL